MNNQIQKFLFECLLWWGNLCKASYLLGKFFR